MNGSAVRPASYLSLTSTALWDREEDAMRYELEVFPALVQGVKSTFSPIHDWASERAGARELKRATGW